MCIVFLALAGARWQRWLAVLVPTGQPVTASVVAGGAGTPDDTLPGLRNGVAAVVDGVAGLGFEAWWAGSEVLGALLALGFAGLLVAPAAAGASLRAPTSSPGRLPS